MTSSPGIQMAPWSFEGITDTECVLGTRPRSNAAGFLQCQTPAGIPRSAVLLRFPLSLLLPDANLSSSKTSRLAAPASALIFFSFG